MAGGGEITDQLPSLFIMAVHTDQIHQDWASGGLPGGFFLRQSDLDKYKDNDEPGIRMAWIRSMIESRK